ncbi:DUF1800 domain-containing protein [Propioniciclava flava]|uniref:DUF1800 domain-containing protein n=2 Tax=Propioniciclava flava TaxID=2072026 RepID=A0A4Q2EHM8_9ACTN|nr:DUF1800 domain-containing protein [Propioniciclava flava]
MEDEAHSHVHLGVGSRRGGLRVANAGFRFDGPASTHHDASAPADDYRLPGVPMRAVSGMRLPVADTERTRNHLLRRAGLGVGAAQQTVIAAQGLENWLADQLEPDLYDPSAVVINRWFPLAVADIQQTRRSVEKYAWDGQTEYAQATLARQLFSVRQVYEVVVDVFSNLLHVPTPSDRAWDTGADYGNQVIRAHALGRYADMLHAAARHPAMLRSLHNDESRGGVVNVDYARALLELHTVRACTEGDVRAAAMLLSGRGYDASTGRFSYGATNHAVGRVVVLGFESLNSSYLDGLEVGDAFIAHLARLPETARNVASRLAVRFISDSPSDAIVDHLARVYLAHDTDIREVLIELFRSDEFWRSTASKVRRPLEDIVGTVRAACVTPATASREGVADLYWTLRKMGHAPLGWDQPDGYPDVASAWRSTGHLGARWNLHRAIVSGWRKGLTPSSEFSQAVIPVEGMTVDAWVTELAWLTLGQEPTDQIRQAAYAFLGLAGYDMVPPALTPLAARMAAMMFNSHAYVVR